MSRIDQHALHLESGIISGSQALVFFASSQHHPTVQGPVRKCGFWSSSPRLESKGNPFGSGLIKPKSKEHSSWPAVPFPSSTHHPIHGTGHCCGWLDKSHAPGCQAANPGLHSSRGVGTLQLHWSSLIRIKKPTISFGCPFLVQPVSTGDLVPIQQQASDVKMTSFAGNCGRAANDALWWGPTSHLHHLSHAHAISIAGLDLICNLWFCGGVENKIFLLTQRALYFFLFYLYLTHNVWSLANTPSMRLRRLQRRNLWTDCTSNQGVLHFTFLFGENWRTGLSEYITSSTAFCHLSQS